MSDLSESPEETKFFISADGTSAAIEETRGRKSVRLFSRNSVDGTFVQEDIPTLEVVANAELFNLEKLDNLDTKLGQNGLIKEEFVGEEVKGDDEGGKIWYVRIVDKDFGRIKDRRPMPHIYEEDFFDGLVFKDNKWMYPGVINAWPGLKGLELVSLEYWYQKRVGPQDVTFSKVFWHKESIVGKDGIVSTEKPKYPDGFGVESVFKFRPKSIRATMKLPLWSDVGYDENSKGFVFYFSPFDSLSNQVIYGDNLPGMIKSLAPNFPEKTVPKAASCHFFAHRYYMREEGIKDRFFYHTGVLVEWDHKKFSTVFELAWLYGLGGYSGKSNFCSDKLSSNKHGPKLYRNMADCLKMPWRSNLGEIRIIDTECKDIKEFKSFLSHHSSPPDQRFIEPQILHSAKVALRDDLKNFASICESLVAYSLADVSYSESARNCQTFAADFFNFLTNKNIKPLQPVALFYRPKVRLFLLDVDAAITYSKNKSRDITTAEENITQPKDEKKALHKTQNSYNIFSDVKSYFGF